MQYIPSNPILKFKSDSLQFIRKKYDLNRPGRMEDAIRILEEWIKKQEHFIKKDFRVTYLERLIINNKGSIEKCKKKIDRKLTMRTFLPTFHEIKHLSRDRFLNVIVNGILPELTPEYNRVIIVKHRGTSYKSDEVSAYLKYVVNVSEYIELHDYCNSMIYVIDVMDVNIVELVKCINIEEYRYCLDALTRGYLRVNGIHFLSSSNMLSLLISLCKQVLTAKLSTRLYTHKDLSTLYKVIPREILPLEYGGKEKPLAELCDNLSKELNSEDFKKFKEEMEEARIDESRRPKEQFTDEYLGLSGTFRTLNFD